MIERSLPEETLFAQVLELGSAAEREAFLDRACGDNRTLRAEVEALVRADDARSGDLLDLPERSAATRDLPGVERPGAVIGPYELVQEIGEGGMGVVWMAEQAHPVRRRVALKIIKPGTDSRRVIARFEAERQALALMDHPNIARVFDAGATECGRPYFIMELVEGVPITTFCDDRDLPTRERLELFLSVCSAMQHAHQKGVIHRDIKPSNVLVAPCDDRPVPKVIDFGVAKATGEKLTERTMSTQCGQLVGTLEYMSPEQASFSAADIDTRSDIYSLGVLFYELLTGSTPFAKDRLREVAVDEVLRIIREEEPPRPSARLSELDRSRSTRQVRAGPGRMIKGELDWIVMKAMEKDRNRRYETVNGLRMDVRRYLADEPVAAGPPTVRYRLRKFARRNKGTVLAATAIVLALVGGIIGTTWGLIRATDARAAAVDEATQKQAALAGARRQLFEAFWNRARAGRYSRQMGQRLDSLDALTEAARIRPDERLRDEAIAAMALPDLRPIPGRFPAHPAPLAIGHGGQGRLYARVDAPGTVSIRSLPDDREVRRIATGPVAADLSFSPDDRFLLGWSEGSVPRVWRVADGQPVLRDEPRECRVHAFSPDGRHLAVGQREWVLCFDLEIGREVRRWSLHARARSLAFDPAGGRLAVGCVDSEFARIYDAASGALLTSLPLGHLGEPIVAWHPDGARLAIAGSNPRIQIWDLHARRRVATLEGHAQDVDSLVFHPEGDLLASHGWDGLLMLWDPSSGRPVLRLASVGYPRFSTDGRWLRLARSGEMAELLEVTPSREYRTLAGSGSTGSAGYCSGAMSPDGRLLAVGRDEGARLWDLHGGRELLTLPPGTTFVFFEGGGGRVGEPETSSGPTRALLTCGSEGLLRWRVARDDPEGRRLRLGPPSRLSDRTRASFARGRNGRTLGAATDVGSPSQILDLEAGVVRRELGVHPNGEVRALSGDGRWAASFGWHADRVRLWEIDTGRMVHEWVLGRRTHACFTPDSRALVISRGDEFSFWDVASSRPIYRLRRDVNQFPGWVAFSPDGRLMAMEMAPAVIHLKEVADGRTVAKLEDPYNDRATWLDFTPDGTRLVVVAAFAGTIHVWDLRAIRAGLKEVGLDWDWPEFPPAATETVIPGPPAIDVIAAARPGLAVGRELKAQRAVERRRREYEADPDSAHASNELAWAYLAAPDPQRDTKTALLLAEKAARLAPGNAIYRNTLGLAYYRAGRYREAVEVLRPNLRSQSDWDLAFDLYFLAMSYRRLGEATRARDYYDWAVRSNDWTIRWAEGQQQLGTVVLEDLAAFRAEAAELLRIERKDD